MPVAVAARLPRGGVASRNQKRPLKPLRSDDSPNARWFDDEVRPHEAELRSYLRGKFSAHLDIDDLIQETYARLLQAREQTQLRSTRGYLFTTARNVALDAFRRRRVVVIDGVAELDLLPVLEDRPGIADAVARDQELQLLAEAIQALPQRCREVITLRKLHGLSHREIAQRLGITENTVNAQVAIGVLRLRDLLHARGVHRSLP